MQVEYRRPVLENIADQFGLGVYRGHRVLERHRHVAVLDTANGCFLVKPGVEKELALYAAAVERWQRAGLLQARIYRSNQGGYASPQGYAVFEFLSGRFPDFFNPREVGAVVDYLAPYHRALVGLEIPAWLGVLDNPWKKADSLDYLCGDFSSFPAETAAPLRKIGDKALAWLKARTVWAALSEQLIHGDLGPGNVLFRREQVAAIVDFTPQIGSPTYALAHFIYWHFLFANRESDFDYAGIEQVCRQQKDAAETPWHSLLVKAAAFRFFGPLLATWERQGAYSEPALAIRATLLGRVLADARLARLG
ncbi:MAG: phosphotransferase [Candidatus Latescibacteria bacterium]|nr:phosphotransferase [Candidatus Latescibacterota bacterium]